MTGGDAGWSVAACSILLAGLATGCLNFQEPEPRRGELQVTLTVTDSGGTATAEFRGGMRRPLGDDGRVLPLVDPTLRVLQRALEPEPGEDEDVLIYADEWTLTPADLDRSRIQLEGPVTDVGRPRIGLSVPFVWRSGPDSLVLSPGEDLRLPLALGSEDAYPDSGGVSWLLTIRSEESPGFLQRIADTRRPPDTVRVQAEVLEAGTDGAALEITLRVAVSAERQGGSLPYDAHVLSRTQLGWRVIVEEPPG